MERQYAKVFVTKKAERQLKLGHPWVYFDEITKISGEYENGGIVDVLSERDKYLGSGYISESSKIRVRVISRNANDKFDIDFYIRRLKYAVEYRRTVMGDDFSACRLIFGEADCFPGLTVDRFNNVLVIQVLSLGIEKIKGMLIKELVMILRDMGEKIDAVYERNDAPIREHEGLPQYKDFFRADYLRDDIENCVIINENGLKFSVDFVNGQKTGYFLDQKYNRRATASLCKNMRVLDCFTHTGGFALCCAKNAASVTAVDISGDALNKAKENAMLNNITNIDFVQANVFDLLTNMFKENRHDYDMIILDPPAFTKSRNTIKDAQRGYKEINLKAMRLLNRGGYLVTCSCSHFMSDELFRKMLTSAAQDASVSLRQIEFRQQSMDHPVLWNVPETDYLKFYIFQVV